jgi:hypothetical protein
MDIHHKKRKAATILKAINDVLCFDEESDYKESDFDDSSIDTFVKN